MRDYTRDMGVTISKEGVELLYPRSHTAVASRAAGIQAVDSPWIDILDKEGLTKNSSLARQLGFNGKMVIHPSQIDVVNEIFSPSEAEIEYARKIVAAYEQAQARGLGATSVDQKMIDIATFRQAQELLMLAERISERHRKKSLSELVPSLNGTKAGPFSLAKHAVPALAEGRRCQG